MCSHVFFDNERQLTAGFKHFAKQYKQLEKKDEKTVQKEMELLMDASQPMFTQIGISIEDVQKQIDTIYTPTMIVQARLDQMINPKSANYIYENIESESKQLNWYEESGHVITLDKERDQLHDDIYTFLESLQWAQ